MFFVIVSMILALIVLGIFIYQVAKPGGKLAAATTQCAPNNGVCVPAGECFVELRTFQCPAGKVCCGD